MAKFTRDEVIQVIEGGRKCAGADLRSIDLSGADLALAILSMANLQEANLYGANLSGADLYGADLIEANLSGADLIEANLSGADLTGADLRDANLFGANLNGADLFASYLEDTNLSGANLRGTDLCQAWLQVASLVWTNLGGAYLHGANFAGADLNNAGFYFHDQPARTKYDVHTVWPEGFDPKAARAVLDTLSVSPTRPASRRREIGLSKRHEVFRKAGRRCQQCGSSASDGVKLEVDHIMPVSRGGSDDISNLQLLCFECNRGKSDRID